MLLACFYYPISGCAYSNKYSFKKIKYIDYSFYYGDMVKARNKYEEAANQSDRNYALWNNQLGSVYLAQGNKPGALDSFLKSYYLMNDISAFSELEASAISLSGSEDRKAYKGDPYEKAINSLYVGLLLYDKGDLENAMAAFKNGILADSDSEKESYKSDFSILYLLASRTAKKLGNESLSKDFEKEVEELSVERDFDNPDGKDIAAREMVNLSNNTLLVFELGQGPLKHRLGKYGEMAVISRGDYKIYDRNLIIDGNINAGAKAYFDSDVYFQANTRGGREMDGILRGQARFKDNSAKTSLTMVKASTQMIDSANSARRANPYADTAGYLAVAGIFAIFAAGSAIASAATNPKADIRHWSLLPANIVIFPLFLAPGKHKIGVMFHKNVYSSVLGESVLRESVIDFEVDIHEEKDNVIFKRVMKDRVLGSVSDR